MYLLNKVSCPSKEFSSLDGFFLRLKLIHGRRYEYTLCEESWPFVSFLLSYISLSSFLKLKFYRKDVFKDIIMKEENFQELVFV